MFIHCHQFLLLRKNLDAFYWLRFLLQLLEYRDEAVSHYFLRIRFVPSSQTRLRELAKESQTTLEYLFLQCRTDFVNDRIK